MSGTGPASASGHAVANSGLVLGNITITSGEPPARRRPMTVPVATPGFAGRTRTLARLLERLDPDGEPDHPPVCVVAGMAGIGKTTLTVRAAHHANAAGWFPGGVLFADTRGFSADQTLDAEAVAGRLLRACGEDGAGDPLAAWRSLLDARAADGLAMLVVLDNVVTAGQVTELLTGPPHRMLVTSRQKLSSLPAHRIDLGVLAPDESADLLDRALRLTDAGDDRVARHPVDTARLADLCGHLPLALCVTAALLRDQQGRPPAELVAELADARTRLGSLEYDDLAVRAAFDVSYSRLTAEQARAFCLLASVPGPDASTRSASRALDRPEAVTHRLLSELARGHLLEGPSGDRWGWHDLLRLYAAEAGHDDDREAVLGRVLEHLRTAGADADRRSDRAGSHAAATAWFDAEHAGLVAAVAAAHDAGRWRDTFELAILLQPHLEDRRHVEDWQAVGRAALDAADRLGRGEQRAAAGMLGNACRVARRFDEAIANLELAHDLAVADGARMDEGRALHNLGLTHFLLGDYARAEECHRRDAAICTAIGDPGGAANSLTALGDALRMQDRSTEAIEVLNHAIRVLDGLGDSKGAMNARINLVLSWQSHPTRANAGELIRQLCLALRTARELGNRHVQAKLFMNLAAAYLHRCAACHGRAARAWAERAVAEFAALGDRYLEAKALSSLGWAEAATGGSGALDRMRRSADILDELGEHADAGNMRRQIAAAGTPGTGEPPICLRRSAAESAYTASLEDLPHRVLRGEDILAPAPHRTANGDDRRETPGVADLDTLAGLARGLMAKLDPQNPPRWTRTEILVFSQQIDDVWQAAAARADRHWPGLLDVMRLRAWQVVQTLSAIERLGGAPGAWSVATAAIVSGGRLVDDCERLLGAAHPVTRSARTNLACVYGTPVIGQYDRACALLLQSLADLDSADAEDPETLTSRHNLGIMHLSAGRPRRARQILTTVLADRERILGPGHPLTAATRDALLLADERRTSR